MDKNRKLTLRQAMRNVGKIMSRDVEDHLANRAVLARRIAELAEDGRVVLVTGGMDCDCASWDGRTRTLPATFVHVNRAIERLYEDAEGPVRWDLTSPMVGAGIRETHRDLALEAFEDGHPHVVYA